MASECVLCLVMAVTSCFKCQMIQCRIKGDVPEKCQGEGQRPVLVLSNSGDED